MLMVWETHADIVQLHYCLQVKPFQLLAASVVVVVVVAVVVVVVVWVGVLSVMCVWRGWLGRCVLCGSVVCVYVCESVWVNCNYE